MLLIREISSITHVARIKLAQVLKAAVIVHDYPVNVTVILRQLGLELSYAFH